ncbi:MAG: outer membrane protein assembly factor BamD [Gammaproteobacteria bacterium]
MGYRNLMRLSSCFLILAVLLSGCSLLPGKIDKTKSWSAQKLYTEAKSELSDGNYQTAIDYFEKLEARYPFGPYSQQAQLEIAYAYYKYDEPESAIAAAERFVKTNPRHPNVAYAYYLEGLINYDRGHSLIDRFLTRDLSERDPEYARKAFYDFQKVVKNYPNSRYADDARQRMIHLRNIMAKYEINVADFYMRRGAYLAAANRAEYVLKNYEHTTSVPPALVIAVKAYRKLKLTKLAGDAQRVLELNFPKEAATVGNAKAD